MMRLLILLLTLLLPAQAALQSDIVYGRAGEVELKLDLIQPDGSGPFPLVICVHGGAWMSGSKSGYLPVMQMLAANGYAAAAVEYRFAPVHKFPAQLDDVRTAVKYLRLHASELKIDPERLTLMGDSAGGHLVLMLGAKEHFPGVRGVINLCGPSDISRWQAAPAGEKAIGMTTNHLLETVFGTSDRSSPVLRNASPLYFIAKGGPAVLTLHGDADPTVKLEQSEWLHQALRKAGAPEKLVILEGAGHGFQGEHLQRAIAAVVAFLAAQGK